jgi:HSF-type DNA-binding
MEILSNEGHSDIISWLPNGRGFMIYNKKRFSVEVLPKYFKKSKFTSFTRKLNRWNFTRITRGPETGAYYHEFFERGNLRLCMQMCCQSSKNFPPSSTSGTGPILSGGSNMVGGTLMGMAHANPSGFGLSSPSALEGMSGINRTLGQSMNRLRLGESMERVSGGIIGNDPLRSILQNQMQAQMAAAAAAVAAGYGTPNVTNNTTANDTLFQQLRQLEHQRDILLKQQQQQQQLQQMHQLQQLQQQQQQLALLGLQGVSGTSNLPSSDLTLGALQRSNTNAYLAMLMAQEKLQAQLGNLNAPSSPSILDFQRQQANILQAQQQQLEHYNQQRLLQAALQQHHQQQQLQLDASCAQNASSLLLSQLLGGGASGGGSVPLSGDVMQGVNSSTSSDSSNSPDLDQHGKLNRRGGSAA